MKLKEAIEKYGKETLEKMSKYMQAVTVSLDEDSEIDTPESDYEQAYRRLKGEKIHPWEWD